MTFAYVLLIIWAVVLGWLGAAVAYDPDMPWIFSGLLYAAGVLLIATGFHGLWL